MCPFLAALSCGSVAPRSLSKHRTFGNNLFIWGVRPWEALFVVSQKRIQFPTAAAIRRG